jgi:hypothetical protein
MSDKEIPEEESQCNCDGECKGCSHCGDSEEEIADTLI